MRLLACTAVLLAAPAMPCSTPPVVGPSTTAHGARKGTALEFDHAHTLFDELLRAHVKGDWLDYRGMAGERKKLNRYLNELHAVTPEELRAWTRDQRFAFWINVYNAHAIALVLDHYPLHSIKDIGGILFGQVWDKEIVPMRAHHPEGKDEHLSLDDVENGILRPDFEDARVHVAINCASLSCPPIMKGAFVAERLEEDLERLMRAFVVDPLRNRFDEAEGKLQLSRIFDWFEKDFARDAGSVREYLLRFAPPEKAEFIRKAELEHMDYDWSLNDVEESRI